MRTTAIINLKGGVGKTTTAINLSYQLYMMGMRVLLIDLDKQGNSSMFFGVNSNGEPSVTDVLNGDEQISDCIRKLTDDEDEGCLHLLPGDITLDDVNTQIIIDREREQQGRLREALKSVEGYDYCIIDCAPNVDACVLNAMTASDDVIVTTTLEATALQGIANIMDYLASVRNGINPRLTVAGCLVTMFRDSKDMHDDNIKLEDKINDTMAYYRERGTFETKIRWSKQVAKSYLYGTPLIDYAPRCAAARCYRKFAKEYIGEV